MKSFKEFIECDVSDLNTLTLAHTTQAIYAKEIILNRKLSLQLCSVFNKKLVYTFYGRPEYRTFNEVSVNVDEYSMICFILNTDYFKNFNRIYPFDSGAFLKNKTFQEKYFHHTVNIKNFELPGHIESAKKIVKAFYQSNINYIDCKHMITNSYSSMDYDIKSYLRMLEDKTNSELDNRKTTIEVIHDKVIPLNADSIKQIIMPRCYLDDEDIMKIINEEFKISEPLTYRLNNGSPNNYWGIINEKYHDFNEPTI